MTLVLRSILLAAVVMAPGAALATTIHLAATLDGAQANAGAGTGSLGTGVATVTFDDVTNVVTVTGSFSGLAGAFTVAHVHGPATPTMNAGVLFGLSVTLDPGGLSGTFVASSTLSAGAAADLLAGLTYVNVHSALNPGGDIRGQILLVPEPTTLALLAGAAACLFARRRRG